MPGTWQEDLQDVHLLYDYDVHNADGSTEKWRYELWCAHENRVVYAIHGGPMAGRQNYQEAQYQCIRPGELWQINWLEETGTIVSIVYDILRKRITTLIAFSQGHWEHAVEAHGDKRNPEDFERWRGLAKIGCQTDRHMLSEQADIVETFKGAGNLKPIDPTWPTI
ncbi:Calycin-like protein [Schizophyllum amplum]|uniref:Calycin-like protein n=1 Tax=Schizophyllum amplum TaxID=97359 RepID=A0A550CLD9_9AGAR|nr:Calycin-like protein [Auriculariopsis ampla]